ncbi:AAA family ATPase [Candidatus Daviesbacteria bacterium]|nr:AAA family ATPase [Candidatus Daviesbacteria bacterium]
MFALGSNLFHHSAFEFQIEKMYNMPSVKVQMLPEKFLEDIGTILKRQEPLPSGMRQHVLYLTGMVGVGKTTVAEILSQRWRTIVVPEFLDPAPDRVILTRPEHPLQERIAAQLWTLEQHMKKNTIVRERSGTVIVDRTWLDSVFYSTIYGTEVVSCVLNESKNHDWAPGLYTVFIADTDTVRQRLSPRLGISESEWRKSWSSFVAKLRSSAVEIAVKTGVMVIDTSRSTPEESAHIIESEFNKHYQLNVI